MRHFIEIHGIDREAIEDKAKALERTGAIVMVANDAESMMYLLNPDHSFSIDDVVALLTAGE